MHLFNKAVKVEEKTGWRGGGPHFNIAKEIASSSSSKEVGFSLLKGKVKSCISFNVMQKKVIYSEDRAFYESFLNGFSYLPLLLN